MILLADNDILLKLASCNLLDEALLVLNVTYRDIRVLKTLKYELRKNKKLSARYGTESIQRALDFIQQVSTIDSAINSDEQSLLSDVQGIDDGEIILFAATKDIPQFLIATGDKKALVALSASETCNFIVRRLSNRVICLEQLVLRIIFQFGFEAVLHKLSAAIECDNVLKVAFASGVDSTLDKSTDDLNHYIDLLRKQTGNLLVAN